MLSYSMDAILECPTKITKTQEISGCPLLIFSGYYKFKLLKKFASMAPSYGLISTASRLQKHYEETVYF